MSIKILEKKIGENHPTFIIVEVSANHNQSIKNIYKIIKAAAISGADAIKLQTYTADSMTLKNKIISNKIRDINSLWKGKSLYHLYKKGSTPWKWHKKIFDYAKKHKLIPFSTPFDKKAVDFLRSLKVPLYKISSFEITDIPLIKYVAKTKKPVILSTGMSNFSEIKKAVITLKRNGCKQIILLKCTSSYPTYPKDVNLSAIRYLKKKFNCEVGLSDHTIGEVSSITSIGVGASVIEKHVTFDKKKTIDGKFSLDLNELKTFVNKIRFAKDCIGNQELKPTNSELNNLKYRRKIVAIKNIRKNEKFSEENIKCLRGVNGLEPVFFEKILKKKSKKNIKIGNAIRKDHF